MNDTQREAQEIIHNITAAYRAGEITLVEWWQLVRLPLLDGFLSAVKG